MESIEMFAAAILIVGALHFVVTVGAGISHWWNGTVSGDHIPAKVTDVASQSVDLLLATPKLQRSDWYVFFHCSDVIGPVSSVKKSQVRQDKAVPASTYHQPAKRLSLRAEARR